MTTSQNQNNWKSLGAKTSKQEEQVAHCLTPGLFVPTTVLQNSYSNPQNGCFFQQKLLVALNSDLTVSLSGKQNINLEPGEIHSDLSSAKLAQEELQCCSWKDDNYSP